MVQSYEGLIKHSATVIILKAAFTFLRIKLFFKKINPNNNMSAKYGKINILIIPEEIVLAI
jgi:hypothetical protein